MRNPRSLVPPLESTKKSGVPTGAGRERSAPSRWPAQAAHAGGPRRGRVVEGRIQPAAGDQGDARLAGHHVRRPRAHRIPERLRQNWDYHGIGSLRPRMRPLPGCAGLRDGEGVQICRPFDMPSALLRQRHPAWGSSASSTAPARRRCGRCSGRRSGLPDRIHAVHAAHAAPADQPLPPNVTQPSSGMCQDWIHRDTRSLRLRTRSRKGGGPGHAAVRQTLRPPVAWPRADAYISCRSIPPILPGRGGCAPSQWVHVRWGARCPYHRQARAGVPDA